MRPAASVVALTVCVAAWSQPSATGAPPSPPLNPTAYLLQALVSLAVVVGLIYGAYFLLRRLTGPVVGPRGQQPARIVQALPLSGATLYVVEMDGGRWLVTAGAGGTQIVAAGSVPPQEGSGDAEGTG